MLTNSTCYQSAETSLTQKLQTWGFTQASNVVHGKNATDSLRNDGIPEKPHVTVDINTVFLLGAVHWSPHKSKKTLEMQGCSTTICLESIKQERDAPARKVYKRALVNCLQAESLNKRSTNMLIYLKCGTNMLFDVSLWISSIPDETWKLKSFCKGEN